MDKYFVSILLFIVQRLSVNGQILVSHKAGVIVTSSSQHADSQHSVTWDIYNVVDSKVEVNPYKCKCCGATKVEINPWYKLDLGEKYNIQRIHVIGRQDGYHSLYNMEIQLSTTEKDGTVLQGVDTSDRDLHELNYTLTSPKLARFITLTLRDVRQHFVICELYVYADCMDGRYGPTCNDDCGKCIKNEACDKSTGRCSGRCSAGYKGDICKEVCSWGKYGLDCTQICGSCKNNDTCNNVDGACTGCVTGYLSPMCKDCIGERYGATCNEECCQCIDSDVCDKSNGIHQNGCSAGYKGTTCKEKCDDGTFGLGCEERCGNCSNNETCNTLDGSCASCAAGYKGNTCLNECQAGTFGLNCKQRCGMCQYGGVCDIYTGECPNGCTDEYKGSQCLQEINQDTSSSSDTSISLPVFIGSLFAVIVVTITIVIGLVWLFYRKRLNKNIHIAANNKDTSIPLSNTPSNYDILRLDNPDVESTYTE